MSSPKPELDLLIIGSGVAGLSAALAAAQVHNLSVGVLTKGEITQSNTRWAQGGVAAVMSTEADSTDLHLADTLAAGAGLCDVEAVRVLVEDGPRRVAELINAGAIFDRGEDGEYLLAREGGHSLARILHAGGAATGAEVERSLAEAVRATATRIHEHTFVVDLIVEDDRCVGVRALTASVSALEPGHTAPANADVMAIRARHVLIATGGSGQLFAVTTNPAEATGDGIAMALRAGVAVADVEFMQFHPSALHHPSMPRPLLSEALRGHGALIKDTNGERFVDELLPRDQVSRAMLERMLALGVDHCLLDARHLENFEARFPSIYRSLADVGLDPTKDLLPIAPAAHYHCGGIVTDLNGATTLRGLWAAGETAASGVHGANRLASNSLLEGMVFGHRAVEAIARGQDGPEATGAMRSLAAAMRHDSSKTPLGDPTATVGVAARWLGVAEELFPTRVVATRSALAKPVVTAVSIDQEDVDVVHNNVMSVGELSSEQQDELASIRHRFSNLMTKGAGVARNTASLAEVISGVNQLAGQFPREALLTPHHIELLNLFEAGSALAVAAAARRESRGCHLRTDFPSVSTQWQERLVIGDVGILQRSIRPAPVAQGRLDTQ